MGYSMQNAETESETTTNRCCCSSPPTTAGFTLFHRPVDGNRLFTHSLGEGIAGAEAVSPPLRPEKKSNDILEKKLDKESHEPFLASACVRHHQHETKTRPEMSPPELPAAAAEAAELQCLPFSLDVNGAAVPTLLLPTDNRVVVEREPAEKACRNLSIRQVLLGDANADAMGAAVLDAKDPDGATAVARFREQYGARLSPEGPGARNLVGFWHGIGIGSNGGGDGDDSKNQDNNNNNGNNNSSNGTEYVEVFEFLAVLSAGVLIL